MTPLNLILNKNLLERRIFPQLLRWIPKKEALILLGSRQVGKSSLLYLLIQHLVHQKKIKTNQIFHFDLERAEDLQLLNSGVPKLLHFLKEHNSSNQKKYLFIDEIQYLDNPSQLLKILVDHHSEQLKIFATGSSSLLIRKKFKDSLVGRKITFEIQSLTFSEYLLFKAEKKLYSLISSHHFLEKPIPLSEPTHDELLLHYSWYVRFGGYPAVTLLDNLEEKKKYLDDIYHSYLRKDINAIFDLENVTAFNKLIQLCALQIGTLVNIQDLARDTGLSRPTVETYLSILSNTYICRFISPFYKNKRKEIVKMSKVYFYDTGLRNRVINNFQPLDLRPDQGALIENAVFKNLIPFAENTENIKFWRLKNGTEVDFVVDEENPLPLEVKSGQQDSVPSGLKSFGSLYRAKRGVVVNKNISKNIGKIIFLPYYRVDVRRKAG